MKKWICGMVISWLSLWQVVLSDTHDIHLVIESSQKLESSVSVTFEFSAFNMPRRAIQADGHHRRISWSAYQIKPMTPFAMHGGDITAKLEPSVFNPVIGHRYLVARILKPHPDRDKDAVTVTIDFKVADGKRVYQQKRFYIEELLGQTITVNNHASITVGQEETKRAEVKESQITEDDSKDQAVRPSSCCKIA